MHVFILPALADRVTGLQVAKSYLPGDEIAQIAAIPHLLSSLERMAGRVAIRHILAQYIEDDAVSIPLTVNRHGRPMVKRGASGFKGDFNLSHANGWIAIVLSHRNRVGIDIEQFSHQRPYMAIAETWFHPTEIDHLNSFRGAQQQAEFYKIWSMKEAIVKGVGTGFKSKPNLFTVIGRSTTRGWPTWHGVPDRKWVAAPLDLLAQHSVAVAVRKSGDTIPTLKVRLFSSLYDLLDAELFTVQVVQRLE